MNDEWVPEAGEQLALLPEIGSNDSGDNQYFDIGSRIKPVLEPEAYLGEKL